MGHHLWLQFTSGETWPFELTDSPDKSCISSDQAASWKRPDRGQTRMTVTCRPESAPDNPLRDACAVGLRLLAAVMVLLGMAYGLTGCRQFPEPRVTSDLESQGQKIFRDD